jgi:hypothetical protein
LSHLKKWAYSRVSDVLLLVLTAPLAKYKRQRGNIRNVEVDSNEDLLALEADIGDG